MSLDLEQLQEFIDKDQEMRRLIVAIESVGLGFGFTETEIMKRTGMESQMIRKLFNLLQRDFKVIEIKCTQIGTAGPYEYFFRFYPEIKVRVSITGS